MRPKGVADAQTVEIPSPPKDLSAGTLLEGRSQVLVLVEIEGRLVPKSGWIRGEKRYTDITGARTANRHR